MSLAAEACQSFMLDNGAFSLWQAGQSSPDWTGYYDFVRTWHHHPGFDFAIIPDVIDGDEAANDALVGEWESQGFGYLCGVPVWHLHESLDRLAMLADEFPRVAFGSSGDYAQTETPEWWERMWEAMPVVCDSDGRPRTKLHGLRMMSNTICSHIPFSSVDSTNVARNSGLDSRWNRGPYPPVTDGMRAQILAERIERHARAAWWSPASRSVERNGSLIG